MAKVTVKLFGVLRLDTSLARVDTDAVRVEDIYPVINAKSADKDNEIRFRNTLVYVNGKRCSKKNVSLSDGDEIWLMSPASGG